MHAINETLRYHLDTLIGISVDLYVMSSKAIDNPDIMVAPHVSPIQERYAISFMTRRFSTFNSITGSLQPELNLDRTTM